MSKPGVISCKGYSASHHLVAVFAKSSVVIYSSMINVPPTKKMVSKSSSWVSRYLVSSQPSQQNATLHAHSANCMQRSGTS